MPSTKNLFKKINYFVPFLKKLVIAIIIAIFLLALFFFIIARSFRQSDYDWRLEMRSGEILAPMTKQDIEIINQISDEDYIQTFSNFIRDQYFLRTYPTIIHNIIEKEGNIKNFISELSKAHINFRYVLSAYEKYAIEFGLLPRTIEEIRNYEYMISPINLSDKTSVKVFEAMNKLNDKQLLFTFNTLYLKANFDPSIDYLIATESENNNLSRFLNERVFNKPIEVQKNIDSTYISTYIQEYIPISFYQKVYYDLLSGYWLISW